ncbi:MAG: hypothetical protein SOX57_00920 [Schaalia hyovaginalis]|uniref:hypothetical protein n=1 Tax=Schaalia hyovaginalis TaxID=29316 RepID=UPI0026F22D29|nr:hypothetical protein [Schaalia hyovaginalis]MCI6411699.1 hypothetical protein [Schaalia hyovaginalis]MDY3665775.1 hypothetical protein [Schaalia hyovaginalis]MDY4261890.1 hypothetical protein [Schaalia hyovaginalis]MDY5602112.1 hypothetical protein [Schaalia hyovaginalis]MDY6214812.1 hypothetical protein [Schaalia hyovaginalis]
MTTTADTKILTVPGEGRVTAVTYQRVSTKEQATTGGRDEGFSIPAQREANRRKAETLGAQVVAEFVGDAAARDHVLDCGVLLPQPRRRRDQGHDPESRRRRHSKPGTDRLPQHPQARRAGSGVPDR